MTASDSRGRVIDGRFELLERLGGGGMGLVWRARDTALHREVALKEVRPPDPETADADPETAAKARQRVLREARALARVHHPNVVTIHHIVDRGDLPHPWLVMELVTGGSLQDRLTRGTLTPVEAAGIGRGLLAGLRAAHAVGVHHRDVKPANIALRPDTTPVLTDFGIASLRDATRLTATGGLIGSPEYIAPERIRGQEGNPASDLWSLGMVLYVATEGVHPLRRETTIATLVAVLEEPVPPPVRSGPLSPVLTALLVRDAAARPDADTLDRMLADVERGAPPASLPAAPPPVSLPAPGGETPPGFGTAPTTYLPTTPQPSEPPSAARRGRRARQAGAAVGAVAAVGVVGALLLTLLPQLHGDGDADAAGMGSTAGKSPSARKGSVGSPTAAVPVKLLSAAGGRFMTDAAKSGTGGTEVLALLLYEDHAELQVPKKTDEAHFDTYLYRGGKLQKSAEEGYLNDPTTVDLSKVDWDALPALMSRLDRECTIEHPTHSYVVVQGPEMSYARSDNDRACEIYATLEGEVQEVQTGD
ncbi:serine/threonine-protein kinase [Actinacidiphila sp. bgisy167]|uniref:serine/threonine-protein kinase n=1 Tax=Actinacidiphila sp. bgisy167 TaxID=3413797 RepID=UPI003D70B570